jgi:hypothetical protein
MVPRWDITGEDTYGTDSPGMTALGDVKQLQLQQRQRRRRSQKAVDPPLVGPRRSARRRRRCSPATSPTFARGEQGLPDSRGAASKGSST